MRYCYIAETIIPQLVARLLNDRITRWRGWLMGRQYAPELEETTRAEVPRRLSANLRGPSILNSVLNSQVGLGGVAPRPGRFVSESLRAQGWFSALPCAPLGSGSSFRRRGERRVRYYTRWTIRPRRVVKPRCKPPQSYIAKHGVQIYTELDPHSFQKGAPLTMNKLADS